MFVHTVQLRAGMMTTFDERMLDLRVEILLLGEMMMLSLTQLLCRSLIAHTCGMWWGWVGGGGCCDEKQFTIFRLTLLKTKFSEHQYHHPPTACMHACTALHAWHGHSLIAARHLFGHVSVSHSISIAVCVHAMADR